MKEQDKAIKILLVEDNAFDAKIVEDLVRLMKNGGFSLRQAGTLQDAMEADAAEKADIALLDLNLPDSFGPETLHRAQKFMQDRPIIVMTGVYEEHLGVSLIKKGAQDYLVKGRLSYELLLYSIKYSIERAKIEARMKQREARLRDILEKTPDGFVVTGPGGHVLFVNRGAEQLLGRRRDALVGNQLDLETDPDLAIQTDLRKPDGRKVPVELRAVQISWGEEQARLIMLRDLTPVRELERNRDEFISRVSHELRSPLTVIKESFQLLRDGEMGEVPEKQKDLLEMGLNNVGRLNRLIDAMLDLTKMEAGVMPMHLERTDLGALLAATAAEYKLLAKERKIAVKAELPSPALYTFADADKLREVLVNLVSNALKFTPDAGEITLSLRPWEGEALICVENTGQGIEPEDLPKLFTKFVQLGNTSSPAVKGTGLGLPICRSIVEMHRGLIWAESEVGKFSKFFILLPLMPLEEALKHLVRRELDSAAGGKRQFCVLTVIIPGRLLKEANGAEGLAAKAEDFLKTHLRSAIALAKRTDGDFTLLLANSGVKESDKAAAFTEKGIKEMAGLPAEDPARLVSVLLYPEDFRDEEEFLRKAAAAREKLGA